MNGTASGNGSAPFSPRPAAAGFSTPLTSASQPSPGVRPKRKHSSPFKSLGFAGLIAFLVLIYSRFFDLFPSLHLAFVLGGAVCAAAIFTGGAVRIFQTKASLYLIGFAILFVIAVPFSTWIGGSVMLLRDVWSKSFLIFVCIMGLLSDITQLRRALCAVALGIVGAGVAAVSLNATGIDGRLVLPQGELANPNALALYMLLGLPLCWFVFRSPSIKYLFRLPFLLAMGLLVYVILRTGSRGALVSLVFMFMACLYNTSQIARARLVVIAAIGGIVLVLALPQNIRDRLNTTLSGATIDEDRETGEQQSAVASTHSRLELLKASIEMTREHPFLGVGPGNYVVVNNDRVRKETGHNDWEYTHNVYTQISSEVGIPALLFYLGAIGSSLLFCRRCFRRLRNSVQHRTYVEAAFALQLAFVCVMVFMAFGMSAYEFTIPALIGFACVLELCSRDIMPARDIVAAPPQRVGQSMQWSPAASPAPIPSPMPEPAAQPAYPASQIRPPRNYQL